MFKTVRLISVALFFASICDRPRPSHASEDENGYEEFEHAGPPVGDMGRSLDIQRIHAGKLAEPGDFTFIVGIQVKAAIADPGQDYEEEVSSMCTGALVSARFVLTASHCLPRVVVYLAAVGASAVEGFSYSSVRFQLTAGAVDMAARAEDAAGRQTVLVWYPSDVTIHVHPEAFKFRKKITDRLRGKLLKDFLLLELKPDKAFSLGEFVRPVPLLKAPVPDTMGGNCKALGFGNQDDVKHARDSKLYFINVKVGGERFCDELRGQAYDKTYHLCALGEGMSDTCAGDSGGPLVCGPPGGYFLTGVLSVGSDTVHREGRLKGCGETNTSFSVYVFPGVVEQWVANITDEVQYVTLEVAQRLRDHPLTYTQPPTAGQIGTQPTKPPLRRHVQKAKAKGSSDSSSLHSTPIGQRVAEALFVWVLLLNVNL